jgi:hypothetical protein
VAPVQKYAVCSAFVRVSDGTRTRDRLDHNQTPRVRNRIYSAETNAEWA